MTESAQVGSFDTENLRAEATGWVIRLHSSRPTRRVWTEFEAWISSDRRRRLAYYQVEREWPERRQRLKRQFVLGKDASIPVRAVWSAGHSAHAHRSDPSWISVEQSLRESIPPSVAAPLVNTSAVMGDAPSEPSTLWEPVTRVPLGGTPHCSTSEEVQSKTQDAARLEFLKYANDVVACLSGANEKRQDARRSTDCGLIDIDVSGHIHQPTPGGDGYVGAPSKLSEEPLRSRYRGILVVVSTICITLSLSYFLRRKLTNRPRPSARKIAFFAGSLPFGRLDAALEEQAKRQLLTPISTQERQRSADLDQELEWPERWQQCIRGEDPSLLAAVPTTPVNRVYTTRRLEAPPRVATSQDPLMSCTSKGGVMQDVNSGADWKTLPVCRQASSWSAAVAVPRLHEGYVEEVRGSWAGYEWDRALQLIEKPEVLSAIAAILNGGRGNFGDRAETEFARVGSSVCSQEGSRQEDVCLFEGYTDRHLVSDQGVLLSGAALAPDPAPAGNLYMQLAARWAIELECGGLFYKFHAGGMSPSRIEEVGAGQKVMERDSKR